MEPDRFGRKLGVGVRVASGMIRDRASQTTHSMKQDVPVYAERGRAATRGAKKFGQTIWGPFAHAGGVLWLEVTGLFFGIFTLFFAINTYKLRHHWDIGPDHQRFLVFTIVTLAFAYFTFSSFYRAHKKEKLRRQAKQ